MTGSIPQAHSKSPRRGKDISDLSPQLKNAINLAATYLKNAYHDEGCFNYLRHKNQPAKQSSKYNILRHLGSIYALAHFLIRNPTAKGYQDCLIGATNHILQKRISPLDRDPTIQCVWSWPKDKNQPNSENAFEAKLGANGLALLALCSVEKLLPGTTPLPTLQSLAMFIAKMQQSDGSFISIYIKGAGPKRDFVSLYYPGEAILGLMSLYEIDNNSKWLEISAKAMAYLAQSRAESCEYLPDHWALIAMPALMRHYHKLGNPPVPVAILETHATKIVELILNELKNNARMRTYTTPVATRIEGCLTYLSLYREQDKAFTEKIITTLQSKIPQLFNAQISEGPLMGGIMREFNQPKGKPSRRAQEVRIDYNQHCLSAWMQFDDLLIQDKTPVEFQNPDPSHARQQTHRKLNTDLLAEVCGGTWHNLEQPIDMKGISFCEEDVTRDTAFFMRAPKEFVEHKSGNAYEVSLALRRGVSAFVSSKKLDFKNTPWLEVENGREAFKSFALHCRDNSETKVVAVTGSYGKTGFKTHLGQLLQNQFTVGYTRSSSNRDLGIFRAICDLYQNPDVAIVEVAASAPKKVQERAELLKPSIAVITSIGHEHIARHKTLNTVIKRKATLVTGIKKGGYCILPKNEFFERLQQEVIKNNPDVEIVTFGDSKDCDAHIISTSLKDYGWEVRANIRGRAINFRTPFVDVYAPVAALAEFLCAELLGADLDIMAQQYVTVTNFKTSGMLSRVTLDGKSFILMDQSKRGGIENYQRFFETLNYMKPEDGGKKLLLTSAFMDHADGDIDFVKPNDFKSPIAEAGLDYIFTVEHFKKHLDVLPDRENWMLHHFKAVDMFEPFAEFIADGDFVAVKGIFESKLYKFKDYLIRRGAKIEPLSAQSPDKPKLRRLQLDDLNHYKKLAAKQNTQLWCAYFPFLYFYGQNEQHRLLIERMKTSLSLYKSRAGKPPVSLYLTPMGLSPAEIKAKESRLSPKRKQSNSVIIWLDEPQARSVGRYYKFRRREQEYLYNYDAIKTLEGPKLKNLRYNLKRFKKQNPEYEIRRYSIRDFYQCLSLLIQWEKSRRSRQSPDYSYTVACLRNYDLFSEEDLSGYVLTVEDKIVAFGFAGRAYEGVGNIFIVKSDLSVRGANYMMKYQLIETLADCAVINDSSDLGNEGMKTAKESFAPVQMLPVYRALEK